MDKRALYDNKIALEMGNRLLDIYNRIIYTRIKAFKMDNSSLNTCNKYF